jgi:hypothetical protein
VFFIDIKWYFKKQGKGNKPKKSQPLTDDEINMLYQKKLLGESTPESLLNTVWFNNTVQVIMFMCPSQSKVYCVVEPDCIK